jgi:integrase/recombinase XerD
MKPTRPTALARCIERFFAEYLPIQRGMSLHTIRSYRDALLLFLTFTAENCRHPIEKLDLGQFTADTVSQFLTHLESDRGNGISTRNARLAALHTFARFLATQQPERLAEQQRILGVPFKRGARNEPLEYLEQNEIKALLDSIDRSTPTGRRDYALLALMFNTGARVQEILDLTQNDVRSEPPCQVRLRGKGGKTRYCPIWPQTAILLRELAQQPPASESDYLFTNRRGQQLTRYGVRYILNKYVTASTPAAPSLKGKRIHPHTLRHTTAIHLLKAGVDFATISQWLGHATLNTTMVYARADLDMKRQALTQVFPDTLTGGATYPIDTRTDLTGWLKKL